MCRMAAWRARHRPPGPGGPARAYRYRLALRRPYRYRYRRWVWVDGGRGVPWLGLARVRAREGLASRAHGSQLTFVC